MKQKYIDYYMDIAQRTAQLSYAEKLKVGAILVKDDTIISIGYNGTPKGWDNSCEDKVYYKDLVGIYEERHLHYHGDINEFSFKDEKGDYKLGTKEEVFHAEENVISKIMKSTISSEGAILFCTCSPCVRCAKLIANAGIKSVYYLNEYRSSSGIEFLKKFGVEVIKY